MTLEEAKTELMVALAAELKAVNDLNEKLAASIEALEARANYQAGTISEPIHPRLLAAIAKGGNTQ